MFRAYAVAMLLAESRQSSQCCMAGPQDLAGFSYAMNELRDHPDGDERARALPDALRGCLRQQAQSLADRSVEQRSVIPG